MSTARQLLTITREHYNIIGQHFSLTRKKKMQPELIEFVDMVQDGMRVLDVGCGSGRLLQALKGKKIYYTGLDFSEVLLDEAKKNHNKRRFLLRDITTDKGWKGLGKFDAVFCLGVLHHIAGRDIRHRLLQNIYHHINPNGFLVLSVWNLWHLRFWKDHIKSLFEKLRNGHFQHIRVSYSFSDGNKKLKTVRRFLIAFFAGQIIRMVKQAGFRVKRFYYARNGITHKSLLTGNNFCLLAEKEV